MPVLTVEQYTVLAQCVQVVILLGGIGVGFGGFIYGIASEDIDKAFAVSLLG